jgi:hypothetical protein
MADQPDNTPTTKGTSQPVRKYRYVGPEYNRGIIVGTDTLRPLEWTDKQIKERLESPQADLISLWFVTN